MYGDSYCSTYLSIFHVVCLFCFSHFGSIYSSSLWFLFAFCWYLMILSCWHLSIRLFVVSISSFVKCLFKDFAHFCYWTVCHFYYWCSCFHSLLWYLDTSTLSKIYFCKYFHKDYSFFTYFLKVSFYKFLILIKSNLSFFRIIYFYDLSRKYLPNPPNQENILYKYVFLYKFYSFKFYI